MVGWPHQLNGHEFEQAPEDEGQRIPACCSPWGSKKSDTVEQLNDNKAKIRRNIKEKKKYITIVRHINIYLKIFYQVQKNKNRSILNDVVNNLNIIDLYLIDLYFALCIFVSLLLGV